MSRVRRLCKENPLSSPGPNLLFGAEYTVDRKDNKQYHSLVPVNCSEGETLLPGLLRYQDSVVARMEQRECAAASQRIGDERVML